MCVVGDAANLLHPSVLAASLGQCRMSMQLLDEECMCVLYCLGVLDLGVFSPCVDRSTKMT